MAQLSSTGIGRSAAFAAVLLVGGCSNVAGERPARPQPVAAAPAQSISGWEQAADPADAERIKGLPAVWNGALAEAQKAGFRKAIAAEGDLLRPGGALLRPAPAPGSYMCRLFQIGSNSRRARAFTASKPSFCYVGVDDDDRLWLAKQTGTQRWQGYLWDDRINGRMIFLGSSARGASDAPQPYGSVRGQDAAGVLDRIGPLRYRLVIPQQAGSHKLEILELRPAPVQNEE